MIEPIMYLGLGFLAACLLALVTIPLVHARAVRLTLRRIEAATPLSVAEIQAEKDQLRAEFAVSTRRLEINLEQFTAKTMSQLVELGKRTATIKRLGRGRVIPSAEADGAIHAPHFLCIRGRRDDPAPLYLRRTESVATLGLDRCSRRCWQPRPTLRRSRCASGHVAPLGRL